LIGNEIRVVLDADSSELWDDIPALGDHRRSMPRAGQPPAAAQLAEFQR
jgi:hypothetical protein